MTSPALRQKINKARAFAPHELPKARLCANVILAMIEDKDALQAAIAQLKQGVGNNWSHITALQFMSGRRGEFAAECAPLEERLQLTLAHLVAKQMCSQHGLGAVQSIDGLDLTKLRALALTFEADMREREKLVEVHQESKK